MWFLLFFLNDVDMLKLADEDTNFNVDDISPFM